MIFTTKAINKNKSDLDPGQVIMLGEKLGEGGEGSVWNVVGYPGVAKIYNSKVVTPEKEIKLTFMLTNPPQDEMFARYNHISITWPSALLYQGSSFSGYLMPRLIDSFKILDIYNPKVRKAKCPGFTWKYLVHTALNLSIAMSAIHNRKYLIGDINEGNILVTRQALVSLIDTDSFQVEDSSGHIYPCPVGKEEFTPPELHGRQFNQVTRLPYHDYFGLWVLSSYY
jgi:DNA-binding helix-hairpin-helix protein with protein kinase domain